jgi:hypothetical protein
MECLEWCLHNLECLECILKCHHQEHINTINLIPTKFLNSSLKVISNLHFHHIVLIDSKSHNIS